MPIPAPVAALCDVMPVLLVGPLAGRAWYMPKAATTRTQLGNAGATTGTLRRVRAYAILASGRIITREQDVRIWDGVDVIMAPTGWTNLTGTGTANRLPAGLVVVGGRNLAGAAGESNPVDVAHDQFVSSGVNSFAQRVLADGVTLAVSSALPAGTIAGPDYQWRNPTGAGLVAVPITETAAGIEWPENAPRG